jgi:hypothetical protein
VITVKTYSEDGEGVVSNKPNAVAVAMNQQFKKKIIQDQYCFIMIVNLYSQIKSLKV